MNKIEQELDDKKINNWIKEQDYSINQDYYIKLASLTADEVTKTVLSSISKKIGLFEGIKRVNDSLKYLFETPIEIDDSDIIKIIEDIMILELKCLATSMSSFSKDTKNKIINKYIELVNSKDIINQNNNQQEILLKLLREQLNKVTEKYGEYSHTDPTRVDPIKNNKLPFGRKGYK